MATSAVSELLAGSATHAPPARTSPETPAQPDEHEHKYLLDRETAGAIWIAAGRHLAAQIQDATRPIGFVRTTYFDTRDLAYFRSVRERVARRIRVREYATTRCPGEPLRLSERCFLELKQSAGGLRQKTRLELDPRHVPAHLAIHPDAPLAAVLTTWYRRMSLADEDERLRLTLDDEICFCAPSTIGSPCAAIPPAVLSRWPTMVLEIKRRGDAPEWLDRALRGLDEARGFSKFNAGMRSVLRTR